MTEAMTKGSNYLTGAVRFENGVLKELVVFCTDPPTHEMEEMGFIEEDYIAEASSVIEGIIKRGNKVSARFDGSRQLYPLEVVTRHGIKTLEVQDIGQPPQFRSLHELPAITAPGKQAWVLQFYDAYKALTQEKLGYQVLSYVSWGAYADFGHKDAAEAAREVFDSRITGGAPT